MIFSNHIFFIDDERDLKRHEMQYFVDCLNRLLTLLWILVLACLLFMLLNQMGIFRIPRRRHRIKLSEV